ncbi:MAG: hypothetical protein ACEPO8_00230 [Rhodothermaceae bacterium]
MENRASLEIQYLSKLNFYLSYELSTGTLALLSYLYTITLVLAVAAAAIFTPFMLFILYREKRFGWINLFLIFIIIPLMLTFTNLIPDYLAEVLRYSILGGFYMYCVLLKLVVRDWLQERKSKIQYLRMKEESARRKKLEEMVYHSEN